MGVTLPEDRIAELEKALARAAYIADHLMQMIPAEDWRAMGGDDGQGHYEGDYHAASLVQEIRGWKDLASPYEPDEKCRCGARKDDIVFDRSICVCGMMHYYCAGCGRQVEPCDQPVEGGMQ